MVPRRALITAALAGACAAPGPATEPVRLSSEALLVAAESWHTDMCLPAAAVLAGPLAPLARDAPDAGAFALGFGLESWMRAARPGSAEGLAAIGGGPAVVSVRALRGPMPPGAEESVPLRLPAGGFGTISDFILGQLDAPLTPAPPGGAWLLLPSTRRYSLGFTCNTWVMAALAAAGLPVPVTGIRFRGEAMTALRSEAARQSPPG